MAITQALTASFKQQLLQGVHNFDTDIFKIALYTNDATIDSTTTTYIPTNEVTGAGYTAGGQTLVNLGVSLSGTSAYTSWANPSWPGATFTTAGALIYNASKGNSSVLVFNFGGSYYTNGVPTFPGEFFPANTSTTAPIIIY